MYKKIFFFTLMLTQQNFTDEPNLPIIDWQDLEQQFSISNGTEFFVKCPLLVDSQYNARTIYENCSVKIKQDKKFINNPALQQAFLDLFLADLDDIEKISRVYPTFTSKFVWRRSSILPSYVTKVALQYGPIKVSDMISKEK